MIHVLIGASFHKFPNVTSQSKSERRRPCRSSTLSRRDRKKWLCCGFPRTSSSGRMHLPRAIRYHFSNSGRRAALNIKRLHQQLESVWYVCAFGHAGVLMSSCLCRLTYCNGFVSSIFTGHLVCSRSPDEFQRNRGMRHNCRGLKLLIIRTACGT